MAFPFGSMIQFFLKTELYATKDTDLQPLDEHYN